MPAGGSRSWAGDTRRLRLVVVTVAVLTTVLKLLLAARTFGTDDVHYWTEFAEGVRSWGPIGIYGHSFFAVYNHPPLIGWFLAGVNSLVDLGLDLPLLIRVPASLADVGTALLLFEVLRRRTAVTRAALAAVLFALSPVMFIVSGFHGNTDPVLTFVALLSAHLVGVHHRHLGGGVAFGLAVSIKLVPVVLAPLLLVLVVRRGVGPTLRFLAGGLVVFLVLWVPVLVLRGPELVDQVLGYSGVWIAEWGVPEMLGQAGVTGAPREAYLEHARIPVLLVASLLPAALVWRRPEAWPLAYGLAFAVFLLLSPAFSMQYLVWPLAAAYLVDWRTATLYNVVAGVFAYVVYSQWNGNRWWHWHEAVALPFTQVALALMVLAWLSLLAVVAHGLRLSRKQWRSSVQ